MNMLAVGVEGDIGAEELSGPASDITFAFSVSIEAEAIYFCVDSFAEI